MRAIGLGVVVLLAGCGATPVEQAKRQWGAAAQARAKGDLPAQVKALKGVVAAAARHTKTEIDADSVQLNLLRALAWADLHAQGMPDLAEPRLKALAAAPLTRLPAEKRAARVAAQCRWAADAGHHYYAALCWDALLDQVEASDAPEAVRRTAIQGFAAASGARRVPWRTLVRGAQADATIARLLAAVHAAPTDADAITVLAQSLIDGCDREPRFAADGEAWHVVQADLLDAVIALDGFSDHGLRCAARADRVVTTQHPLCDGKARTPKGLARPRVAPAFHPKCQTADPKLAAVAGP